MGTLNLYAKMGVYVIIFLSVIFCLGCKTKEGAFAKGMFQTAIALCLLLGMIKIFPAANQTIFGVVNIPSITVAKEDRPDGKATNMES